MVRNVVERVRGGWSPGQSPSVGAGGKAPPEGWDGGGEGPPEFQGTNLIGEI